MFAGLGYAFGIFDFSIIGGISSRIYGTMTNVVMMAVPLFVFMGVMLERSQIAEDLLESMGKLMGRVRGGLPDRYPLRYQSAWRVCRDPCGFWSDHLAC